MGCITRLKPGCRPCPEDNCKIFIDTLSSGNPLSDDWEGDTASYTKSSGVITTTTASKIITSKLTHPSTDKGWKIFFTATTTANGDKCIGIVDYVDANNYHFAEVTWGSSATLKLFKRTGGTDTQLGATVTLSFLSTGLTAVIDVCLIRGTLECIVSLDAFTTNYATRFTTSHNGTKAGVGSGGTLTGTLTLDDINIYKGESDEDQDCGFCLSKGPCTSFCVDGIRSTQYRLVVNGMASTAFCTQGNCNNIDGSYIVLMDNLTGPSQCFGSSDPGAPFVCGTNVRKTATLRFTNTGVGGDPPKLIRAQVRIGQTPDARFAEFEKIYDAGVLIPCLNLNGVVLTYARNVGSIPFYCDGSAATVTVYTI